MAKGEAAESLARVRDVRETHDDYPTGLLAWGGGHPWPVSLYMIALVLIAVVSELFAAETYHTGIGPDVADTEGKRRSVA